MKFKSKEEAVYAVFGAMGCIPFASAPEKEPVFVKALIPPFKPPFGFNFEKFGQGTWLINEERVCEFRERMLKWAHESVGEKLAPFAHSSFRKCLTTNYGSIFVIDSVIYRNIISGYATSEGGILIPHVDFLIESYVDRSLMVDPPEGHVEILKSYIQGDSREAIRCRMSLGLEKT